MVTYHIMFSSLIVRFYRINLYATAISNNSCGSISNREIRILDSYINVLGTTTFRKRKCKRMGKHITVYMESDNSQTAYRIYIYTYRQLPVIRLAIRWSQCVGYFWDGCTCWVAKETRTHARTHIRTHAVTHARTHTYTHTMLYRILMLNI